LQLVSEIDDLRTFLTNMPRYSFTPSSNHLKSCGITKDSIKQPLKSYKDLVTPKRRKANSEKIVELEDKKIKTKKGQPSVFIFNQEMNTKIDEVIKEENVIDSNFEENKKK